jgi:(p)ppGpp synthase/HD superfamily hydrolase
MVDKDHKNQAEIIRRRKKTVIKKIHQLGKLPGIEVAFILRHKRQYTIYRSIDRPWASLKQIVRLLVSLRY